MGLKPRPRDGHAPTAEPTIFADVGSYDVIRGGILVHDDGHAGEQQWAAPSVQRIQQEAAQPTVRRRPRLPASKHPGEEMSASAPLVATHQKLIRVALSFCKFDIGVLEEHGVITSIFNC